jgi:putative component of toxin-antitoxin plasmid stabilization module
LEKFKRSIQVYKNPFGDFYYAQPKKVQDRIDWTVGLIHSLRIEPNVYFDHITGSDGIWEIRSQVGSNIFRVFCCFDEGNLLILLIGFQKKIQKTPQRRLIKQND